MKGLGRKVKCRGSNSRHSQLWTDDDDRMLKELVVRKASKTLMAAKLRRSVSAVLGRIDKLGMAHQRTGRPPRKTQGFSLASHDALSSSVPRTKREVSGS